MEKIGKSSNVLKVASVVLAIILWAYVAYGENPESTRWIKGVPITVVGTDELDAGGYYLISADRSTVDVKLKGDRLALAKAKADDIYVKLDVSKVRKEGDLTLTCDLSVDSKNVDIADSKHNSVVITTEEITTDIFPVSANIVGSPANGYRVFNPAVSVGEVTVRGAKSVVKSIASVSTKSVSVAGVGAGNTVSIGLTAFDKEGKAVSGVTFDPPTVDVKYDVYKEKTVPLTVVMKNIPVDKDVLASPAAVKIYAPSELLSSVTEVKTEPVDVSEAADGETVKLKLNLPYGVTLADGGETAEITFKVTQLQTVQWSAQ